MVFNSPMRKVPLFSPISCRWWKLRSAWRWLAQENLRKLPYITQFFRSRAGSQTQTACKDIPKIVFLSFLLLMNQGTSMRISHSWVLIISTPHTKKRLPAYALVQKSSHPGFEKAVCGSQASPQSWLMKPTHLRTGNGRNTQAPAYVRGHPQT